MVTVVSDKPVKTKKVICPNCGFELEYTGVDVTSYEKTDYSGDTDTYYYIVCPRPPCGKKVNVSRY
jgi:hypothetical protein